MGVQAQDFQLTYDLGKTAGSAVDAPNVLAFGKSAGDNFGRVIRAGDITGDGIDDLIMGAPGADAGSPIRVDVGAVYVWFGKDDLAGTKDVAAAEGSAPDVTILGASAGDELARDGALMVTDVDGDGVADLVIGALLADGPGGTRPNAGEAYIVYGRDSSLDETYPSVIDLGQQGPGGADVTIFGASLDDQLTIGGAMAVGDVNGDGAPDLLLGSVLADGPADGRSSAGEAYIVLGRVTPAMFPQSLDLAVQGSAGADVTMHGATTGDFLTFGGALGVGDVNEDGIVDVLLGARDADGPNESRSSAGEAYVVLGRSTFPATLDLGIQGIAGADVTLYGANSQDQLTSGGTLAVGDVNGDGFADLLLGALGGDGPAESRPSAGEAYIISGRAIIPATLDLAIQGSEGASATVYGASSLDGLTSGGSLAVGDVNGDGFTDLLLGAPLADGPGEGRASAGEAYIVLGGASFPAAMDLSPTTEGDHADVTIYGASTNDNLTIEGALTVGDVNGDGAADLLLGARLADGPSESRSNSGEAYVVLGRSGFPANLDLAVQGADGADVTLFGATGGVSAAAQDQLTSSAALSSGDINGDGFSDLIVGAIAGDGPAEARSNAGEAYVIFGTGSLSVAPDIAIEQPAGTNIPDGGSRFGAILIGASATRTFTIKNTGSEMLSGLVVEKDGADAGDYTVGQLAGTSLTAGASLTYTVTFAPTAVGTRSASLHVASNDPNENPFDIILTGTGTAPEIVIEQPVGTAYGEGAAQSFGTMHTGGQAVLTFTIRNTGSADLSGLAVTKDGPQAEEYLVGELGSTIVAAGSSTTFTVAFAPTGLGLRSAGLSIASNDEDENPFAIALTGIGKLPAPEITIEQPVGSELLNQDEVTLGIVPVGSQSNQTFTVKNTGSAVLNGLALSEDGTHETDYDVGPLGSTSLLPGASTTFAVTFHPGAAGIRTVTLLMASNDEDENPFHLHLSGTGVDPEIVVEQPLGTDVEDEGSQGFGALLLGDLTTKTFTIRNVGTTNLTDLAITKSGDQSADFAVGELGAVQVAPGESTTFAIAFSPTAPGTRHATVHIANNDGDENPFEINLLGTGLAPEIAVDGPADSALVDGGTSVNFGGVVIESSGGPQTFTIRNEGNSSLMALELTKSGAAGDDFVIGSLGATTLDPGESTTFTVTFNPTVTGNKAAVIHLTSNDANESPFDIPVTGVAHAKEPVFPEQVLSRWATLGQPAALEPVVTGSDPKIYQWYKGGVKISGVAGSNLKFSLAAVKAGDAGVYNLRVTNAFVTTAVSSANVYLGVITRGLAGVQVNAGATLNLTCTAIAPKGATLTYEWQRGGGPVPEGGRVSGTKAKALKITGILPEEAGTYTCQVTMTAPGSTVIGNNGDTSVIVVQKPTIESFTLGDAYVGESINFVIPRTNNPTSFTVTGLPPGVVVSKTGVLSGKPKAAKLVGGLPAAYVLKIKASNSAGASESRSVDWTILPLDPGAIGTFNGLVERHATLNGGLGGTIKVVTTSSGGFTGTLKLGSLSYPLTGTFTTPPGGGNPTGVILLARKAPLTHLTVTWIIHLSSGKLEGIVDDPIADPAPLTAWRSPWTTLNKATLYANNYTAALTPEAAAASETPSVPLWPEGEGYALLAISPTGTATWSGKLADGSAITGSTTTGPNGQVALQLMLYTNTGSLQGWSVIDATGNLDGDGTVDWAKASQPTKSTTRSYKVGIPLHQLALIGGRYLKPSSGPLLGLPVANSNAQIHFIGGGLETDFAQTFTITDKNAAQVPSSIAQNPQTVKMTTLTSGTGLFSGSFTPSTLPKRTATFNGVVVPRLGRGAGYFLLQKLPEATGETMNNTSILSGGISLGAAPAIP